VHDRLRAHYLARLPPLLQDGIAGRLHWDLKGAVRNSTAPGINSRTIFSWSQSMTNAGSWVSDTS